MQERLLLSGRVVGCKVAKVCHRKLEASSWFDLFNMAHSGHSPKH
jgi:hypothetical protein